MCCFHSQHYKDQIYFFDIPASFCKRYISFSVKPFLFNSAIISFLRFFEAKNEIIPIEDVSNVKIALGSLKRGINKRELVSKKRMRRSAYAVKDLKKGEKLDGEGGFCARGKLITSEISKKEKILPLGLTDKAILKKDISKDEIIKIVDVELNLPDAVLEARNYQYNLIN